jgi:error-prone DNA polymerase
LSVIGALALAPYFLAAGEVAEECKRQGFPFVLRGSAGASLVLHLLGLSDVEPVSAGLRFERFLHAGRDKPPDVDIEFSSHQRGRVLGWLIQRHGGNHVARVGVYKFMRATPRRRPRTIREKVCASRARNPHCRTDSLREVGEP